jgi:hypothetical protein
MQDFADVTLAETASSHFVPPVQVGERPEVKKVPAEVTEQPTTPSNPHSVDAGFGEHPMVSSGPTQSDVGS